MEQGEADKQTNKNDITKACRKSNHPMAFVCSSEVREERHQWLACERARATKGWASVPQSVLETRAQAPVTQILVCARV